MSTIDKQKAFQKNPNAIPRFVIRFAKFLQLFSTRLTAKFCAFLFVSPIKHKTPEREKMMRKSASKEFVLIPSIKKEVMIYTYGYSKKKILLVHGWSGRGTQLYAIADKLLENGYMTISFDGPAHGLSPSKKTNMPEFINTIQFLDEKLGPFEASIGHSFGGMSLMNVVANGATFKKLITIGIGNTISEIINDFRINMELKSKLSYFIKRHFDKKHQTDLDLFSSALNAKKNKIPTFVIHDSKDIDVAVSCAYTIRQSLSKGRILITNGLGHRRILKNKNVIDQIVSFIKDK